MNPTSQYCAFRNLFCIAVLWAVTHSQVSQAAAAGSRADLWDVSQGATITATSGIWFGFDAADMFGGENSFMSPGQTVFEDGQPTGYVHYAEWRTPTVVNIGQIDLYAAGDGPEYLNQREFERLVLKAKSPGSETYDLVILDLTPGHPYALLDPTNGLLLQANVEPFAAQEFRAEITQFDAGRGYDGPRIIEIDAFEPAFIAPSGDDLWDITQGILVVQNSAIRPGFDVVDMFGGNASLFEPEHTVFADDQPPEFIHYVEWQTATAVQVGLINVFAAGDGEVYLNQREFSRLVIKAKSPNAVDYDLVLVDYTPSHPYTFIQNTNALLLSTVIPPVYARDFRIELTQYNAGRGYDGPRILELDAFPPGCSPAPAGQVGWWPGNGDGADVVGGHDGTLENGLGFAPGLVGQAMVFDGVDDHVRIPFSESLISETFSMEAWIKPLGPVMDPQWNQDFVFGQALGSPWLVVRPGAGGVRPVFGFFVHPFLYPEVESSVELPLDEFSHVACTWDGIGLRIYVNGVLAGESFPNEAPVPATCDFYVGGHRGSCAGYDFEGGYFHGSVDELSLYDRALSAAEIAAIHAAGSQGKCPPSNCVDAPSGIVGWWPGNGDGADVVGGHDGTLEKGLGFAPGLVGQAFAFSAPGQHLLVPASPDFVTGSFTLETWINPDAARLGEQQPIFEFADESGPAGVHLWLSVSAGGGFESPGALFANIRSLTTQDHLLGTGPDLVAGGAWNHVALTYDSGSGQGGLYLNGELVAEANLGSIAPNSRQALYLGYRPLGSADAGGGYTFGGMIDEPGFYRRALSAAEIAAIHAAGSAGKCPPSPENCAPPAEGLLGWWPGEGSGWDELGRHEGEVTGAAYAEGVVGQGFLFDGEAARVRIPFEQGLGSTAFTVEAWVQPLGQVVDPLWGQDVIFGQALGSPTLLVRPGTDGVTPVFGFTVNPFLTPEVISSVELPIGAFNHVAGSWDGTALRIYVNGVLTGETVPGQVPALSTCDYFIGGQLGNCAGYGFDGGFFQGMVDELSLYGRALSAFEIERIHAAGGHGKCALPGYALTVETSPGGSVLRDPEAAEYRPGQIVTLTAVAEAGFAFAYWEGAVTGTDPEVTVLMEEPKQVTAVFMDVAPPQVTIESPVPGVTELQTFVLTGQVTDNLGLGPVRWEYNGQPLGTLPLTEGRFLVEALDLVLGENHIRIYALDVAGNEGMAEVVVEWVPARLLSVVDTEPRQEGQRLQVPLQLTSGGDVGGASFLLRYNPDYLKQPFLRWMPSVNSALNQVNTDIPGEVRATFALPALAVPAGTETLAVVTFRARSVPSSLDSTLTLSLLDISKPTGDPITESSATRNGTATILVRRMMGDNNANQRLDVGDATIVQRLLTGLEPVRPWDTTGNDVNQNTQLDSGDVIRVLRAAVGLDPQPTPQSAGSGGTVSLLSRHNLQPMSESFAGTLQLEADQLRAAPGELVTVRVLLDDVPTSLSAVALRLDYPVEALRLLNAQSHRVGALVPATAVAVWNVAPAQNDYALQSGTVSLALSSALAWPSAEGVLVEFSFQVQDGQSGRHQWPIRVSQAELSADGYDMTSIPDATLYYVGRDPLEPQLVPAAGGLTAEGFAFSFLGETGLEYTVEVSTDLVEWLPLASRAGADETITVVDPAALGGEHRFYRVRFE